MKISIILLILLLLGAIVGLILFSNANQELSATKQQLNIELGNAKETLSQCIVLGRAFHENGNFGLLGEGDCLHQGLIIHLKRVNDGAIIATTQSNYRGEYEFRVKKDYFGQKCYVEAQAWREGYPRWPFLTSLPKEPKELTLKEGKIIIGPTFLVH